MTSAVVASPVEPGSRIVECGFAIVAAVSSLVSDLWILRVSLPPCDTFRRGEGHDGTDRKKALNPLSLISPSPCANLAGEPVK